MGIIRKTMSVGTAGLVSYRNADERSAKYAKQTRNAARAQVAQNAAQLELQRQQLTATDYGNTEMTAHHMSQQPVAPAGPPPGWYTDPENSAGQRWWDGQRWTNHRQQSAPPQ
ncbi:DUF2510 domain-containing protein [Tsukamurella ocularis]